MGKTSTLTKALIFCGGVGTRMWPMSRKANPKQFQPLVGDKSMFQVTVERVLKGFLPQDVFVSTGAEYVNFIYQQAPTIPNENIIAEPVRRDTLGAVGLANEIILRRFPNAIVAAIWGADHIVKNEKEFNHCLKLAADYSALHQQLVKIDVKPTFPSIYNGWVRMGKEINCIDGHTVHQFVSFIEKPNLEKAKQLFLDDKNLINTGYLVWPA